MKLFRLFLTILGVLAVLFWALTYLRYQGDLRAARERVLTGSQVIQTRCGPIEYADRGKGPPVLVIHGAGGGYDQGLILAQRLVGNDYRVIAPSRFGFLHSPLQGDGSFGAQADGYACLLDGLKVKKVAIIGFSAGGPSTIEFVLRHPDRSSAMVLASAVVRKEPPMNSRDKFIHYGIFKSDFIFWIIANYFETGLITFFGVTPEVQATLTPEEKSWISRVMIPAIHPISLRQPGMVNDRINFTRIDYSLNKVTVPTLVIYARDDTLVNPSHSEEAANKIPHAKVIAFERGGHLLVGHSPEVQSEVKAFLKQHP